MIVVVLLCLLIISGLIVLLVIKKKDHNKGGNTEYTVINHSPVVLQEDYWRRWRYPRYYRRGIIPVASPYYVPQSMISETCLNQCCDYEKCNAGLGCNWKGLDDRWHVGTPTQCLMYRNCVNNAKKGSNMENHINCAAKASLS